MAAYDERPSDADRRSRELDRRIERNITIQAWVLGFITGGGFATLAWAIIRGG